MKIFGQIPTNGGTMMKLKTRDRFSSLCSKKPDKKFSSEILSLKKKYEKLIEIPYGKQFLDQIDENEVIKSLRQKFITTGKYVQKFENTLSENLDLNLHMFALVPLQVCI